MIILVLTGDEANFPERYCKRSVDRSLKQLGNSSSVGGKGHLGGNQRKRVNMKKSKSSHQSPANKLKNPNDRSQSHKARKRGNTKMKIERKQRDRVGKVRFDPLLFVCLLGRVDNSHSNAEF